MIFENGDRVHLKNLMEMIRDKLVLNNLDCSDVSKVYKAFEWLQALEAKMGQADMVAAENDELREALDNESSRLLKEIESLEEELKEARKPKRKPRTTRKRK